MRIQSQLIPSFYFSNSESFHFTKTDKSQITKGGYESLIGNTPLVYLPHLSSLLPNNVKIFVKMENMNPGGTGKDRAARSMILDSEKRGELPPPLVLTTRHNNCYPSNQRTSNPHNNDTCNSSHSNIPINIQTAIQTALRSTQTHGLIIEGTSGSTGISLASISSSRGHGVIVVMPDDQSSQKREYLERLGCGVVVVKNCSIANADHYVNVARRIWEWVQVERKYDDWYWKNIIVHNEGSNGIDVACDDNRSPRLIKAAFMNQFENLANLRSHYSSTGPEIYDQLGGEVDAFVMSAGTGGTIVGVGGYLKDRWWMDHGQNRLKRKHRALPRIVLVDPPGSSLYNKVKFGVAYASQMSEQRLRRHRYDTLAEGIGLDRITANFGLGVQDIRWSDLGKSFRRRMDNALLRDDTLQDCTDEQSTQPSKVIDDAIAITDQQAVYMAHYLLRHEGLFVGSSTAMNIAGALITAYSMPPRSNVVTVVCDGGQRHTARFWDRTFVEEWGLTWPVSDHAGIDESAPTKGVDILHVLGIES